MPTPPIKFEPLYDHSGLKTGSKLIANMPLAVYLKLKLPPKEQGPKPKDLLSSKK